MADCRVADIAAIMEAWAPPDTCEPGDNVGLLAGFMDRAVHAVLIALDVDEAVVACAKAMSAELIVSHHPHIYRPISAVTGTGRAGKLTALALEAGIALYAAHTNLDRAAGGVNDALCETLGLVDAAPMAPGAIARAARLGAALSLDRFAGDVRARLSSPSVRVTGDGGRLIRTVAVVSGAGRHDMAAAAGFGADCLLTGEIGYHDALDALDMGLAVVEAGHYHTERPVLERIEKHLQSQFQRLQYTVRTAVYAASTCPFRVFQ